MWALDPSPSGIGAPLSSSELGPGCAKTVLPPLIAPALPKPDGIQAIAGAWIVARRLHGHRHARVGAEAVRLIRRQEEPGIGVGQIDILDDADIAQRPNRVEVVVCHTWLKGGIHNLRGSELELGRHKENQVLDRHHVLTGLELCFPLPIDQRLLERRPRQIGRRRQDVPSRAAALQDMGAIENRHAIRRGLAAEPVVEQRRGSLLLYDARREHKPLGVVGQDIVAIVFQRGLRDLEHQAELGMQKFLAVAGPNDVGGVRRAFTLLRDIADACDGHGEF